MKRLTGLVAPASQPKACLSHRNGDAARYCMHSTCMTPVYCFATKSFHGRRFMHVSFQRSGRCAASVGDVGALAACASTDHHPNLNTLDVVPRLFLHPRRHSLPGATTFFSMAICCWRLSTSPHGCIASTCLTASRPASKDDQLVPGAQSELHGFLHRVVKRYGK